MIISELINKLEEIKKSYGDIQVLISEDNCHIEQECAEYFDIDAGPTIDEIDCEIESEDYYCFIEIS